MRAVDRGSAEMWHARRWLGALGGHEAWLVGAGVATPDERARAAVPEEAAAELSAARLRPPSILRALEDGWLLLVRGPALAPVAVTGGAPSDLLDLVTEPPPPPEPEPERPEDVHDVEVRVLDALGRPQAGIAYELEFPDGTVTSGRTDANGHLYHAGLRQTGTCSLTFPELQEQAAA
ncbi:MAG: hypothetical protein AAF721_09645 [Myxococcota bacterium]